MGDEEREGADVPGVRGKRGTKQLHPQLPVVLRRAEGTERWMEEEDLREQDGNKKRSDI